MTVAKKFDGKFNFVRLQVPDKMTIDVAFERGKFFCRLLNAIFTDCDGSRVNDFAHEFHAVSLRHCD